MQVGPLRNQPTEVVGSDKILFKSSLENSCRPNLASWALGSDWLLGHSISSSIPSILASYAPISLHSFFLVILDIPINRREEMVGKYSILHTKHFENWRFINIKAYTKWINQNASMDYYTRNILVSFVFIPRDP